MGIFNADVIINVPLAFFSLQKSGLVRVYLTSVFLLLSVMNRVRVRATCSRKVAGRIRV